MLDITAFGFMVGIVTLFIYEPLLNIPEAMAGIIICFLYVFIEPVMLASWGTTPGKALFRVRLRDSNNSKPTYPEALTRAFNVWIRGIGLGIPIVALFTQITAYNRLTKESITSWDKEGGFKVSHQIIGVGRVMLIIAIFMAFVSLMVLGESNI